MEAVAACCFDAAGRHGGRIRPQPLLFKHATAATDTTCSQPTLFVVAGRCGAGGRVEPGAPRPRRDWRPGRQGLHLARELSPSPQLRLAAQCTHARSAAGRGPAVITSRSRAEPCFFCSRRPRLSTTPPPHPPPHPPPQVGQDALEQTSGTLGTLELSGHTDTVVSLAFNAAGTLLATGSLDATVRVWSAADGACLQTLEGPADDVHWVTWHPKGDVVLAGSEDFSVWMWLARGGDCMQVFSGHRGPVTAGAFTADGKAVVTVGGEGDASLRVWNPKTCECTLTVSGHPFHEEGITCLALHGDGDAGAALTGGQDGSVRVTNTQNGRVIATPAGGVVGRVACLCRVCVWCVSMRVCVC